MRRVAFYIIVSLFLLVPFARAQPELKVGQEVQFYYSQVEEYPHCKGIITSLKNGFIEMDSDDSFTGHCKFRRKDISDYSIISPKSKAIKINVGQIFHVRIPMVHRIIKVERDCFDDAEYGSYCNVVKTWIPIDDARAVWNTCFVRKIEGEIVTCKWGEGFAPPDEYSFYPGWYWLKTEEESD